MFKVAELLSRNCTLLSRITSKMFAKTARLNAFRRVLLWQLELSNLPPTTILKNGLHRK